ncbi:MAG: hypothetical protein FWH53_11815, partial [Leptospirales bacterium]|nr:hypothetical protein [Leptospirales bacterium]
WRRDNSIETLTYCLKYCFKITPAHRSGVPHGMTYADISIVGLYYLLLISVLYTIKRISRKKSTFLY